MKRREAIGGDMRLRLGVCRVPVLLLVALTIVQASQAQGSWCSDLVQWANSSTWEYTYGGQRRTRWEWKGRYKTFVVESLENGRWVETRRDKPIFDRLGPNE